MKTFYFFYTLVTAMCIVGVPTSFMFCLRDGFSEPSTGNILLIMLIQVAGMIVFSTLLYHYKSVKGSDHGE